jgi:hypothetical protein
MTAEYAALTPVADVPHALQLTVVEGSKAVVTLTPLERFQLRPRIVAFEYMIEHGRLGVVPAFNGSLMDFVQNEAVDMREREPFGAPNQSSQEIGRTALSHLASFYHELKQQGNDDARDRYRTNKLEKYGRVAVKHYAEYPEISITNYLAAEYKAAGKPEVVRAIGDVMIAYGHVIESLRLQAEGYPEPVEE